MYFTCFAVSGYVPRFSSFLIRRITLDIEDAFLANFKSQFAPGYNYPNTNDAISRFLAPGYINLAAGMDFKTEKISVFLSPATGTFTFVTDDDLSAVWRAQAKELAAGNRPRVVSELKPFQYRLIGKYRR